MAGLLLGLGCGEPGNEPGGPAIPWVAEAADVADALRQPDPLVRAEGLARAFQGLGPDALPAVLRAYEEGFFDLGDTELVLLAEWWARFDAPAALEWSKEEYEGNARQVQQAILRAWARGDPEAALRAAESQQADGVRAAWTDAVLSGWDESGKPGAFEFVRSMSPGEDRQRAVATLARRKVLRDGVDAAFDWAEALPDEGKEAVQFKLELLRRVGGAAAELDPERAAERAGRLADGPYANGVLRRVGTRWATRDGEAAMRWLATLPSGFARDDGVGETYRFWVRSSREEALAFMRGPAGEEAAYEPARALYAQVLAREDPLAAIDVAREISDDKLRWASVGRVWRQWWVDDADAANAWFEANAEQIPEFYRQRIRIIPQAYRRMAKEKASAAAKGAESPEAP